MSDGDSFYQKVRRETARLLGYEGTDNLPADQATRLDLATALRLGLDDMQARLLRGESVDVSKMLAATQELSRLLPTPAPAPRRDGTSARERLRAIVLAAIEADRAKRGSPRGRSAAGKAKHVERATGGARRPSPAFCAGVCRACG